MAEVTVINPGRKVTHVDGRAVAAYMSDDHSAICYELVSKEGVTTRIALTHETIAAMVLLRAELMDAAGVNPSGEKHGN